MKRFFIIFFMISLIGIIPFLKYSLTKGFCSRKVYYLGDYKKEYDFDLDFEKFRNIFDQKFFYLGKGRQSFAFESEDGKHVVKFVRYHKYKTPFWAEILIYLNLLSEKNKIYLDQKLNRYKTAFKSYKIAFLDLKDLTRVKYLHLNQTCNLRKKIIVKDKLGMEHVVNLDKTAFILQDRASFISKELFLKRDAEDIILSFFDSIRLKRKYSIKDRDLPNLIRNSGVIGKKFIEVDIGSFEKKDISNSKFWEKEFWEKEFWEKEFFNSSLQMEIFLKDNAPSFLTYFYKIRDRELRCIEE